MTEGKVSLPSMTPERIEEIKQNYSGGTVGELLAALEEAQQKIGDIGNSLEIARVRRGKAEKEFYNADRQYHEQKMISANLRERLADAEQTIARQREALEWYGDESNYDQNEDALYPEILDDGGDRARATIGNKEGDSESCAHKTTRKTGDIMVLSDGYEVGIAVCEYCGKEVPEKEDES